MPWDRFKWGWIVGISMGLASAFILMSFDMFGLATPVLELTIGLISLLLTIAVVIQKKSTHRRSLESTLVTQHKGLNALHEATLTITRTIDWQHALQKIVEEAKELLGARYAALAVLKPEKPDTILQFLTAGLTDEERRAIGEIPKGRGLLGEVIRTKSPLRLDHIQSHPSSVGFPSNHPPMHNFMGLPLLYQDEVVGHLYLTEKSGGFTQDDQFLAELFARQAAIVIANARLFDQTSELATIKERERIGRDLHDGVLQTIYGTTLALDNILAEHVLPPTIRNDLSRIADTLGLMMTDIRFFIQMLEKSPIDFEIALRDMIFRLGLDLHIDFTFDNHDYRQLSPDVAHDLLLSAQEAISNAVQHGNAHRVFIHWHSNSTQYRLTIRDNGQGFDTHRAYEGIHLGLRNMRRRIEQHGGQLHIHSDSNGTDLNFENDWK